MSGNAALVGAQSISLVAPTLLLYAFLTIVSVLVAIKTRTAPNSMLRKQVFSWWFITPVLTAALFFYPIGMPALTLLICALAAKELDALMPARRWQFRLFYIVILVLTLMQNYLPTTLYLAIFAVLFAALVFAFLKGPVAGVLIPLLFALTSFCIGTLMQFTNLPLYKGFGLFWLIYLLSVTAFNDVAQYIFGTLFGKQKIVKRISPNKTWQGLLGGVAISVALSIVLGSYLRLAGVSVLILLGLALSIGGFVGDILLSAAKRFLGIKDFSNLIPGHGGMLDRVDSLIITAPLLYIVLQMTSIGFA